MQWSDEKTFYSLDSLVENLGKDNFKYFSQEFDNNISDLHKQKGFYSYEYTSHFKKFKEQLPSKRKVLQFLHLQKCKNIIGKQYEHALNIWNKFEMKTIKYYHDLYLKCDEYYHNLYLKCDVLLLADVF